jgi:outer membrane protein TolC
VAVAAAEIDRADALVKQARSGYYPSITGNATYTRLDHERVLNGRTISDVNQLGGNVTVTLPLVAAQGWTNTRHAQDNRRVTEINADDVRRQIALAAARAYITVVAQHRLIAAAETARTNAQAHYTYAHTRLVGGVGRALDEVRAAQDLATDEANLQGAYTALSRAREALGVLLGAAAPIDSVDEVDLGAAPSLGIALDDAQNRRPDVRAQEGRVTATQHQVDDMWAYYTPYLAAVGTPFVQLGSALQPQAGWQAQLVLTLPFYDAGLRTGISRERRALLAESHAGLDATLRQARSEVRVAFEAMIRADQALGSAREAASLAKRAYELALLAYQAGATDNLQVIDAAARQRDADVAAAQAEDVARQGRLDLLVASARFP